MSNSSPRLGSSVVFDFDYLSSHDRELVTLAKQAQGYASSDAGACLMKLRLFAELMARNVGERHKLARSDAETADDYLNRLEGKRLLPREIARRFHEIRIAGNAAAHGERATSDRSRAALRQAYEISQWFENTYGARKSSAGSKPGVTRAKAGRRFAPNTSASASRSSAERLREGRGARNSTAAAPHRPFELPKQTPSSAIYVISIGIAVAAVTILVVLLR